MSGEHRHSSSVDGASKIAEELKTLGQALTRTASRVLRANGVEETAAAIGGVLEPLTRLTEISKRYQVVSTQLQEAAVASFAELEADLRDAVQARGWKFDGQWPNFIVERALDVKIDEANRTASVAGRKVQAASAKAIVDELSSHVVGLLPKDFNSKEFLHAIAAAYDTVRGSRTTVALFDVYRAYVVAQQSPKFWRNAVVNKFEGVSADQFRARLTKALESASITASDGRALRLLPPVDPKDALFVYQPAEKRFAFVGRIEFVRES